MLINPGGPGGSGHAAVASYGKSLSYIVEGRFDIIGFDPRGVNMSYPALNCFANAEIDGRLVYDNAAIGSFRSASIGLPSDARKAAEMKHLRLYDSYVKATVDACTFHGNQKLLRSMSTSFVARDMKRLVEELGETKLTYWVSCCHHFLQSDLDCRAFRMGPYWALHLLPCSQTWSIASFWMVFPTLYCIPIPYMNGAAQASLLTQSVSPLTESRHAPHQRNLSWLLCKLCGRRAREMRIRQAEFISSGIA